MPTAIKPATLLLANSLQAHQPGSYCPQPQDLAQVRHIFLDGNRLRERWQAGSAASFTLIETGFGGGLLFLASMALWQEFSPPGWLHYVALEEQPLTAADLHRAQALWPELAGPAQALLEQYPPLVPGFHRLLFPEARVSLTLIFGEVGEQLGKLEARAQAWFLSERLPRLNPEQQAQTVANIARLSAAGASLSTANAPSELLQELQSVGFVWAEAPEPEQPAQRQVAHYAGAHAPASGKPWLLRGGAITGRRITVIGAGIAGASAARALAERGWQVCVLEAGRAAATAASGNPAAIIYPKLAPPALADEHFQQQAFLLAQRRFRQLAPAGVWQPCGLLWFLAGNQAREGEKLEGHPWPAELVRRVDASEASRLAGLSLPYEALYFPTAGVLQPQRFCQALLEHANIRVIYQAPVQDLDRQNGEWRLTLASGQQHFSPQVVVATAYAAKRLRPTAELPLKAVRGQVSSMAASALSQALSTVLCYGGYLSPAQTGRHCLGASFYPGREDDAVLALENEENRVGLAHYLPELAASLPPTADWQGRAALRCQSPDYLPLVGPLPDLADFQTAYAGLRQGQQQRLGQAANLPGLYCMLGFGSKGFTTALLAAEVLAAELNQEPCPVPRAVLDALHPARLWARQLSRRQR